MGMLVINILLILFKNRNYVTILFDRSIGYIPSNYVKEKELLGLQKYE